MIAILFYKNEQTFISPDIVYYETSILLLSRKFNIPACFLMLNFSSTSTLLNEHQGTLCVRSEAIGNCNCNDYPRRETIKRQYR